MNSTAIIEGAYRYSLARWWDNGPRLNIVMLNPSTADAKRDDPTIRLCIEIAKKWGYNGIEVRNLFAFRVTRPESLLQVADPIGPKNDEYLQRLKGPVLCAWGTWGLMHQRCTKAPIAKQRVVLGLSKHGIPLHPLALRYMGKPIPEKPIPWS